MVSFIDSNSVPPNPSRARPRVQGSIFATNNRTVHQEPSLLRFDSHSQVLQGKSTSSPRRLHRVDHSNQQYSILALTDSSGAVVERVAYQAYGQPTFTNAAETTLSPSAKATRYSYTGREWDSSLELHHFRARWMSGIGGRFCGRDPIGFRGGDLILYRMLNGQPLFPVDPFGLKCTYYVIMADFFSIDALCQQMHKDENGKPGKLPQVETDKCDRVAPVCCWIEKGKKVCRSHFPEKPDPIVPGWPTRDDCPLKYDEAKIWIPKVIDKIIPAAMHGACKGRNKCDCGDFFYTRIPCDQLMYDFIEKGIENGVFSINPCKTLYKWNCIKNSWEDPKGEPQ